MFGSFSNSLRFERPEIGIQITNSNLKTLVPPVTVWFDFSSNAAGFMTVSGSTITAVVDRASAKSSTKSGTITYLANAVGTNGCANLSASGGEFYMTGTGSFTKSLAGMSVIYAVKPVSTASNQYLGATEQGDLSIYYTGTTWACKCASGVGTPTTNIPIDTTKWQLFSFVFNGAGSGNSNRLRFRYNKADVTLGFGATTVGTTTNGSNDTFIHFTLNDGDFSKAFKGYVGEVLLFNKALSPGQVSSIEQYLGSKWGV